MEQNTFLIIMGQLFCVFLAVGAVAGIAWLVSTICDISKHVNYERIWRDKREEELFSLTCRLSKLEKVITPDKEKE